MKGHPVLLVGRNRRSGSHRKHAHIVQCIDPAPPDLQLISMCTAPLVNRLNIKVRQCSVSSLLQGYENQIYEGLVSVICNVIFGTQQKKRFICLCTPTYSVYLGTVFATIAVVTKETYPTGHRNHACRIPYDGCLEE